jgi:CheY-like chemotaxis protein
MKALMVMPSMLLSSVPDAFAKAGFKIHLAENATFALTMLERDQPDLIVSSDELGDMSGRDLHEIVRSDPAMNSVTFILLDGTPQQKITDSAKDLELSWMTSASEIVKAAKDLLGLTSLGGVTSTAATPSSPAVPAATINAPKARVHDDAKPVTPSSPTLSSPTLSSPTLSSPTLSPSKTMFPSKGVSASRTGGGGMKSRQVGASGTLEIFTLFDLAVSLTGNLKIGKLYVRIADDEGMIFFYRGALSHAEYKFLTGEAALLKIFADADEFKSDTEFVFEPLEVESLPKGLQTITNTIDKLLFNVAVELDHQREAKAREKLAR